MSETDPRRTRPTSVHCLIIGTLLGLTFMSLVPVSPGAPAGKMEVFPVQQTAPAVVFIKTTRNEVELRVNYVLKTGCLNSVPTPR